MSKTTTINYKGGSRRIDLPKPDDKQRIHLIETIPEPLDMSPETNECINTALELGTELDRDVVEDLPIHTGFKLFIDILDYWQELHQVSEEEVSDDPFSQFNLNENGAVDLEDME